MGAQNILSGNIIEDPSFERARSSQGSTPRGWKNCGAKDESPVDVHSNKTLGYYFYVDTRAEDGEQYVGMTVRNNGTTECMSYTVKQGIPFGEYEILLTVAVPKWMRSLDRLTGQMTHFDHPVVLRVVGEREDGETVQLTETPPVSTLEWKTYRLMARSADNLKRIRLEAHFALGVPGNGYVLIDRFEFALVED